MCDKCDWIGFIESIEEVVELASTLEDEAYATKITRKMEDLSEAIDADEHVTEKQSERILNIKLDIEDRV